MKFSTAKYGFWQVIAILVPLSMGAQNDSTLLLRPEQLTEKDVFNFNQEKRKAVIRSLTREDESPQNLPFSTWVITSDEILRNGYVTLADVLKSAPGIRVSQPGNALEGETFMMRGMTGNEYVKILINDVPIKPIAALGMPIGAQLPVRQAERIEVIYGAGGAILYGEEACAGVVNIILKETERPIFTQADLGFGRNYNSLDLMFGGKLFKAENILRFSLYGSNTVRTKTDVFWDSDVYNMDNYLVKNVDNAVYLQNPNYVSRSAENPDNQSFIPAMAHESRLFGLLLTWRGVKFNYNRMSREDPSYTGMSPLAVSYGAPGSFHRDQEDVYALSLWKKKERYHIRSVFSLVNYELAPTSNARYVFDKVNQIAYLAQGAGGPAPEMRDSIFRNYNTGVRYRTEKGFQLRWESSLRNRIYRKTWWENGFMYNIGSGFGFQNRYTIPPKINVFNVPEQVNGPFQSEWFGFDNLQLFSTIDRASNKFRVLAGVGYLVSQSQLLPRLAAQYNIDSVTNIYLNGALACKTFHIAQSRSTYNAYTGDINLEPLTPGSFSRPEKTRNMELGFRRSGASLAAFYQESFDLLRDGYFVATGANRYTSGYFANDGLSQRLWGLQGRFESEVRVPYFVDKVRQGDLTIKSSFYVQYATGKEWFGAGLPSTDEIRNMPRWITQFRLSVRSPKFQVTVASNRQTNVLSKAVTYQEAWQRNYIQERYPTFRTWDAMFRFYLNDNFLLYCNFNNIFDRASYGLDATGSPDDLLMPLQQGRIYRFGVTYTMN